MKFTKGTIPHVLISYAKEVEEYTGGRTISANLDVRDDVYYRGHKITDNEKVKEAVLRNANRMKKAIGKIAGKGQG